VRVAHHPGHAGAADDRQRTVDPEAPAVGQR
jgi:hypothetical protein